MGDYGTTELLLQIIQCRCACAVYEKRYLPIVLYCLRLMYKYYSHLEFLLIKHNKGEIYIHNEIFNNINHFIKNCLHVDYLQYGFVVYKKKVTVPKIEVIRPKRYSMIPMDFCIKIIYH